MRSPLPRVPAVPVMISVMSVSDPTTASLPRLRAKPLAASTLGRAEGSSPQHRCRTPQRNSRAAKDLMLTTVRHGRL